MIESASAFDLEQSCLSTASSEAQQSAKHVANQVNISTERYSFKKSILVIFRMRLPVSELPGRLVTRIKLQQLITQQRCKLPLDI